MSISVLLADDQELIRQGLRTLLSSRHDVTIVGEAASGRDAVESTKRLRPDVVLMDIRMPGIDGIEATSLITRDPDLAGCHVLMLTTFEIDDYLFDALRAGAAGFLLKTAAGPDIVDAVATVARGDALLSPRHLRLVIEKFARRPTQRHAQAFLAELTPRERDILTDVGTGATNDEIAARRGISHATARTHVSRIMGKLGVHDRAQLVVVAYECGLLDR